jgi:tRNA/rRNA methyltransferase
MIANARVVLVRPHFAGNVGSVARVMKNFGLTDLVLVAPFARHLDDEARRMSTHGESILHAARIVETLDEAVADCQAVLGTSGMVDGLFREQHYGRPDEMFAGFAETLDAGPQAIVFGPEPSGLSNAEIARCHGLIRIPTDHEYTSLNLAQSVAICLYEMRRQYLSAKNVGTHATQKVAPFADQERMFEALRESLEQIHFLWGTKADSLMHAVRHLIARAKPSPNEVRILFGLARQLRWVAENGVPDHDEGTAEAGPENPPG